MTTLAYCALSFRHSVAAAAGVTPITSPPLTAGTFHHTWLEGHSLIYIKLHGLAAQPFWYGDNWQTAISAKLIRQASLPNTTIFVANCYLADSPMLPALLATGATIIGGYGPNFARSDQVYGTDVLGRLIRRLINRHIPPTIALPTAKLLLRQRARTDPALLDALDFRLYQEDHHEPTP